MKHLFEGDVMKTQQHVFDEVLCCIDKCLHRLVELAKFDACPQVKAINLLVQRKFYLSHRNDNRQRI